MKGKQTTKMCSRIDMQSHAGRLGLGLGFDLWPFDVRVNAYRGHAMVYRLWCW